MAQSRQTIKELGRVTVQDLITQTSTLNVEDITVNSYVMDKSDSGNIFILGHTAGSTVQLPAPSEGFYTEIFVGRTAASHIIVAPSANIVGGVTGTGVTNANTSIIAPRTSLTIGSTSVVGDKFSFVSDGSRFYLQGHVVSGGSVVFA